MSQELQAVITEAICKVFNRNPEEVCKHVHGPNDPGGWSKGVAKAVVYCDGIPTPSYNWKMLEKWNEIENLVQEAGFNLYHEPVNSEVICFYEV
jgi:hypothetical protein